MPCKGTPQTSHKENPLALELKDIHCGVGKAEERKWAECLEGMDTVTHVRTLRCDCHVFSENRHLFNLKF